MGEILPHPRFSLAKWVDSVARHRNQQDLAMESSLLHAEPSHHDVLNVSTKLCVCVVWHGL